MKAKKRYVLHPGYVRSRIDGDLHFITAAVLAQLYNVPMRKCVVHRPGDVFTGSGLPKNLVHLYPRYDGDYRVRRHRHKWDKERGGLGSAVHICDTCLAKRQTFQIRAKGGKLDWYHIANAYYYFDAWEGKKRYSDQADRSRVVMLPEFRNNPEAVKYIKSLDRSED
jgi:hypothetical protein